MFVPLDQPAGSMTIGLSLPKGAIPRRAVVAFVVHCRSHVTGGALPSRQTGSPP
ncbi:MAG: hypothetical protein WCS20_12410 [Alphaproteobacteria bacterium]